jgi:hypothetical protein
MARVPPILRDLLRLITSGLRQDRPALTGIVAASAFGYFEPRLRWEWPIADKAHARGIQLLLENLSPNQRAQYEYCRYFDVVGGHTGRLYRISTGTQMNVRRLDKKGRAICVLCFAPEGSLVVGDVMLAQKLALELFESDALKIANRSSPNTFILGPLP